MDLADLRTLLDYHYWARDRMLAAVGALTADELTRDLGSSFKSVRDTVAHMYGAEWVWYQRWTGASPPLPSADRFPDAAALASAWAELEANARAFLEDVGEAGVTRVFEYRLLNGTLGATPLWAMVQHVVNHGSYHRGQVTTMLRQMGAKPPQSTDMIAFYRQRDPVRTA